MPHTKTPEGLLNKEVANELPDSLQAHFNSNDSDVDMSAAQHRDRLNNAYRENLKFIRTMAKAKTNIQDVREKNSQDPTQTKAAARIHTADYADKKKDKINAVAEGRPNPSGVASVIQKELDIEKRQIAQRDFSREFRDRLNNMSSEEARHVIKDAISNGNKDQAASALGAPAGYFCNVDEKMFETLNESYDQTFNAADLAAIKFLKHMQTMTDNSYSQFKKYANSLNQGLEDSVQMSREAIEAMKQ